MLPWFCACSEKMAFKSIDITGANYATELELPDTEGRVRRLSDFKGQAVVLFFGYTQCPDVCPTTLQELTQARQLLGPLGEKVQGIFVTIDPERDTAEVLRAYMQSFDSSYLALVPSAEQLAQVAKFYKVYYKKSQGKTPTSYTMDHTAASFVYDPQGRIRLYTRYGLGPQALADDLRLLLK
ncbi:MAG: SCO family protein [Alphaproteobacteria bacterium]|nr:SCO family protein [Alphaproteobacteria bacterium]